LQNCLHVRGEGGDVFVNSGGGGFQYSLLCGEPLRVPNPTLFFAFSDDLISNHSVSSVRIDPIHFVTPGIFFDANVFF
jgi:hypothetical protein